MTLSVPSAVEMTAPPEAESDLTPMEKRHFAALERRIERGLTTFREVGLALLEIRDKRLFRLTHPTFESYCRDRWSMERSRAYQLMGAAEVAQYLPDDGDGHGPVNEAQARELVPVYNSNPSLVTKVWEAVTARNEPVTAPLIREVVREVTGEVVEPGTDRRSDHARPVTATAKLVNAINKATADAKVWSETHPSRSERKQVVLAANALVQSVR